LREREPARTFLAGWIGIESWTYAMSAERKVAVITGASQGIGAGLVRGYLDRGYRVVANSRSIKPEASDDLLAVDGDIADPAVADRVIGSAVEKFGRVDTLVNNAGIFVAKSFIDYTEADFANVMSVNVAGFFHVSQRAVRQMLAQNDGGHIVNVTTTLVGQPVKGVASALASLSKGGLDAVTRSLAIEYADKGIRVNAVAPGVIKTPMHPPETRAFLAGLHPLGRMGEIQEIVDAVLYLESSAFITGETLHVDGGAHAGHW
jgi:NAD(P)-dependent dehydrogenase (short-subunit alcohol dehydrogenase family)